MGGPDSKEFRTGGMNRAFYNPGGRLFSARAPARDEINQNREMWAVRCSGPSAVDLATGAVGALAEATGFRTRGLGRRNLHGRRRAAGFFFRGFVCKGTWDQMANVVWHFAVQSG